MRQEKKFRAVGAGAAKKPENGMHVKMQEYARVHGMMLYNFMAMKSTVVPFTTEMMELNRIGMTIDPKAAMTELQERQQSAMNFPRLVETFGKQLFGSARYEGEKLLAENSLFALRHIPVKAGVERRASMFHIGGFIPYSDNVFRLLPGANFFEHFIANGIEVYEMKLKCDTTRFNSNMLELSIEAIVDSVHEFSDIAFNHCGQQMILEGYCGTGINTFNAYLADLEGMARKFKMIVTFVSPLDARKCTIFEQLHEVLDYINPNATNVDGHTISSLLDTIQERNFEKTPMGAIVHGWKNKEWAKIRHIEDLTLRQQSELAAWYWLSLQHGAYYPLSRDLYLFYSRLFNVGVSKAGVLPYEHKGHALSLKDLKKTGVKILAFLGDKDHLVNFKTADMLPEILGDQCQVVVHEKTGHVAYIFNPNRWQKDDPRAFKPAIIETIFASLPADLATAKPAAQVAVEAVPAKPVPPEPPQSTPATKSRSKTASPAKSAAAAVMAAQKAKPAARTTTQPKSAPAKGKTGSPKPAAKPAPATPKTAAKSTAAKKPAAKKTGPA